MSNAGLSAAQKAKAMQDLMTSEWRAKFEVAQAPVSPSLVTDEDRAPCYQVPPAGDKPGVMGCKHYQRACKKRAACCSRFVACRLCHDEAETHQMDRHATKEMLCMFCGTVQPCAQKCGNAACGKLLARYFCNVCKFWEDKAGKDIYHCPHCGICRIGKGLEVDFFHCFTCGACMSITMRDHKCIENNLKSNCPICHHSLFTSTDAAVFLPCQHLVHNKCLRQYNTTNYKCPICNKSLADMSDYFRQLDVVVDQHKMPLEFVNTRSNILCNDCDEKSQVRYHYVAHKCLKCNSYNTSVLSTENFPSHDVLLRMHTRAADITPGVTGAGSSDAEEELPCDGDEDDEDEEEDDEDEDEDEEAEEEISPGGTSGARQNNHNNRSNS